VPAAPDLAAIDATLRALARQPFRAKFRLRGREAATVELRGMDAIRCHAAELLVARVAPAPREGEALTADQQTYAVEAICRWIEADMAAAGRRTRARTHVHGLPRCVYHR